jgi:hypothetical protein
MAFAAAIELATVASDVLLYGWCVVQQWLNGKHHFFVLEQTLVASSVDLVGG